MDRLVNLTLINEVVTESDIGEPVVTETATKIRGMLESVTRDEWFSAYKTDINAKHRITVYDFEYSNQKIAELNGERYAIYRTYFKDGNRIELYLGEKGGI